MTMRHHGKCLATGLGLLISVSVCGELRADQVTPSESQPAPAQNSYKPQPGEILLSGTVVSIDATNMKLILKATSFTLPNGKSAVLTPPKDKPVLIGDATAIHPRDRSDKLTLGDLKTGDAVMAIGPDAGSGKELAGREIVLVTMRSFAQQPVSSAPVNANSLEIKAMTPQTPALLAVGEKLTVKIHYNNSGPNPVKIFALLRYNNGYLGGFESNVPSPYATGSGDIEGWFKIDQPVAVDQVQVTMLDTKMLDAKTERVLVNLQVPVQMTWGDPRYKPDFGEIPVKIASLLKPEPMAPAKDAQTTGDKTMDVEIISLKAPAKLSPTKEIILYANPGKNFKVDMTVKFKTPLPTKLASNLLLQQAKILPPEFSQELSRNHNTTWHFDTETRPGFKSAEGEGEITFDLIGLAPKEKGKYTFTLNLGLFDKKTSSTKVLKLYPVTLITDRQLFDEIDPRSPQPK